MLRVPFIEPTFGIFILTCHSMQGISSNPTHHFLSVFGLILVWFNFGLIFIRIYVLLTK